MLRKIQKKIIRAIPYSIKKDLFRYHLYTDNAILYHNPIPYCDTKIFAKWMSLTRQISVLFNMVGRKIARMELDYVAKKFSKNEAISRNAAFNNKHKGERCFIIANGPSLKKQDLKLIKDEFTIATNTIWKHQEIGLWNPTYYCTAHVETFYADRNFGEGFENATKEEGAIYFKKIRDILNKSIYFIPYAGYEGNKDGKFLPKEKTFYTLNSSSYLFEAPNEFPDLTRCLPGIQDSSQYAIQLALAMGFSQIILLGCDHDWYVNRGEEKHFFEGPAITKDGKVDSSKFAVLPSMWFAWSLWRGHFILKEIAEKRGVEIINATGGGVLDAYKLGNYEEIVKNKKK